MMELNPLDAAPQGWFNAILAALGALALWVVNMYRRRHETLEKRVSVVENTYVTRDSLARELQEARENVALFHTQNSENFRELRELNAASNKAMLDFLIQNHKPHA